MGGNPGESEIIFGEASMKILEVTTNVPCSLNCSYCPQGKLRHAYRGPKTMNMIKYLEWLRSVPENVKVVFAGMSEPWLNNYCTDMVLWTYMKGHEVAVYTTLVGMFLENIAELEGIPFTHFVVHKIPTTPEGLVKIVEKSLSHVSVEEITGANACSRAGNLRLEKRKNGKVKCSVSSFDHNVLLPNGDVVLCCMDYSLKHVLGNLNKQSYDSIIREEEYELCHYCNLAEEV